jgi:hypothetical protein
VNGFWNGLGEAESAAMAASGGANALYFARRVARGSARGAGARRVSAAVLTGIFAGVALDSAGHLGGGTETAAEVIARAPLLVARLATNALLAIGAHR